MLSLEARNNLIASLLTAENTEIVEALTTDINELVDTLNTVGAVTEEGETATFTPTEVAATEDTEDYKAKYEALQKKFVARFTNSDTDNETPPVVEEDTPKESGEDTTIDSLFKEEE